MRSVRLRESFGGHSPAASGGAKRDRTADLLHAMQALSQLSYGPISVGAALGHPRRFQPISGPETTKASLAQVSSSSSRSPPTMSETSSPSSSSASRNVSSSAPSSATSTSSPSASPSTSDVAAAFLPPPDSASASSSETSSTSAISGASAATGASGATGVRAASEGRDRVLSTTGWNTVSHFGHTIGSLLRS